MAHRRKRAGREAELSDRTFGLSNKLVAGGSKLPPADFLPSQLPLKRYAFPGAETARKQFLLRGQAPLRRNYRESGVHAAGFE